MPGGTAQTIRRSGCPPITPVRGESCPAGRRNTVDSVFGPLVLRRNYYSPRDRAPLDVSLGIVEGCTPGLARLMCRAGALEPYQEASRSLAEYCGVPIEGRRIQRLIQQPGPEFGPWTERQAPPPWPPGRPSMCRPTARGCRCGARRP